MCIKQRGVALRAPQQSSAHLCLDTTGPRPPGCRPFRFVFPLPLSNPNLFTVVTMSYSDSYSDATSVPPSPTTSSSNQSSSSTVYSSIDRTLLEHKFDLETLDLDDELLSAPLESFAALCWEEAVRGDDWKQRRRLGCVARKRMPRRPSVLHFIENWRASLDVDLDEAPPAYATLHEVYPADERVDLQDEFPPYEPPTGMGEKHAGRPQMTCVRQSDGQYIFFDPAFETNASGADGAQSSPQRPQDKPPLLSLRLEKPARLVQRALSSNKTMERT
ncbi:hypothetical protein PUNSTDRAFT_136590 [Punctularia strigosozonata HHB-11173 SS5]|uniref:uncharacterized protein n=1 Tax=Punctularia strigosozonata (strain HHB-11173) TaxID=741275 RepID=UPI00044168EA|nr:uncharacterized protein PUNSTDRAFT_136590 [Punctularia strigosozonata HHB-11173 SS5]EIN06755.1 hypothetical protein PUNSTDRAFT_136590 [Punctularia strigosozonata HHB-11173 SS5]